MTRPLTSDARPAPARDSTPDAATAIPAAAATPTPIVPRSAGRYVPWVVRLVARNPAIFATLVYVTLTSIGVLYDGVYFFAFRLNIFDYASSGDFLLAALREPLAILLCVLPVGLVWAIAVARRWLRRVSPRYDAYAARYEVKWRVDERWFDIFVTLFVVVYAALFTTQYALASALAIRHGGGHMVRLDLISDAARSSPMLPARPLALLGTTTSYVLVYDHAGDSTYVLPAGNVARIALATSRHARVPVPGPVAP